MCPSCMANLALIGAGITYPPMEAFEKALLAFARQEGVTDQSVAA